MRLVALLALGSLLVGGCRADPVAEEDAESTDRSRGAVDAPRGAGPGSAPPEPDAQDGPAITLAFAGDVHFEGALAAVPGQQGSTLGELSQPLRSADVAMVNLESPVTTRGTRAEKEREVAGNRYWFRSDPAALDVLDRSGVDVVSVANNHAGDYGVVGLRDTVRAGRASPVAVVGAGLDRDAAFTPYRQRVTGTDVAIFAADSSFRESADPVWAVRPGSGPGLAAARVPDTAQLLAAVRESARVDDLVVVYLHWGDEGDACPSSDQQTLARDLAAAGADIVVGTHAHVLVGAGMLDDTYVSYGLGNFHWYNGSRSATGVLRLTVRGGEVVRDRWVPGEIGAAGGAPTALTGGAGERAVESWRDLRGCSLLAPGPSAPSTAADDLAPYESVVGPVGPTLRARMRGNGHDQAACPVALGDLRRLAVSYVDLDGAARTGVLVVHRDVARDVVSVFRTLYESGFPIEQMRTVDVYGGDDNASMAANNSSAYNCRTVAGTDDPLQPRLRPSDRPQPGAEPLRAGRSRAAAARRPLRRRRPLTRRAHRPGRDRGRRPRRAGLRADRLELGRRLHRPRLPALRPVVGTWPPGLSRRAGSCRRTSGCPRGRARCHRVRRSPGRSSPAGRSRPPRRPGRRARRDRWSPGRRPTRPRW